MIFLSNGSDGNNAALTLVALDLPVDDISRCLNGLRLKISTLRDKANSA